MSITVKKENDTTIDHEQRITRLEANQNNNMNILLRIENNIIAMDNRIEKKFQSMDNRMEKKFQSVENTIVVMSERIDKRFEKIESRIWYNFYWMIAGFAGILAVMAHGFKWI